MADSEAITPRATPAAEVGVLTREMGKAYARTVAYYVGDLGMNAREADELARDLGGPNNQASVEHQPADQVSWLALSGLAERDPEAAVGVWERLKSQALAELSSGHRAAEAVDWDTSPWDRARFLAMRTAFREEWVPQGGIEDTLLDSMALSFSAYLFWMGSINIQGHTENKRQTRDLRGYGRVEPPRLDGAEAIEMAANMADRFHKMFLRTLRALRDLRRYIPAAVVVQNAGQVNLGIQQVNVARNEKEE